MSDADARILVVDDYAYNRLSYSEWLVGAVGAQIDEAATVERALQLVRERDFAAVLLNIGMRNASGVGLEHRLSEESPDTPIIFVTAAEADGTFCMRGYRMGAVEFLSSIPLAGEVLAERTRVFVELFHKRRITGRGQRDGQVKPKNETLSRDAMHDDLTGLPNGVLFRDRLHASLARASRSGHRCVLLFVDTGFTDINDQHGHPAGDALIIATARRLTGALRESDTVARLGADDFGIVVEGLDGLGRIEEMLQRLHKAVAEPLIVRDQQGVPPVPVETSIGAALYPDHAKDMEDLITLARLTMPGSQERRRRRAHLSGRPGNADAVMAG